MTKLTLNEAQLKAIYGGMGIGDPGPPPDKGKPTVGAGGSRSSSGGIDTVTIQRDRDLPGA